MLLIALARVARRRAKGERRAELDRMKHTGFASRGWRSAGGKVRLVAWLPFGLVVVVVLIRWLGASVLGKIIACWA